MNTTPAIRATPQEQATNKGGKLWMEGSFLPPLPSVMNKSRLSGSDESVISLDVVVAS